MREIKFRAWDGTTNKMWYDVALHGEHYCIYREGLLSISGRMSPDSSIVIMQFTGLKDKNGKEIYEGDVVRIHGILWEVVWNEYESGWKLIPYSETLAVIKRAEEVFCVDGETDSDQREEIEVIGNIYQNPELLKDGDK